MSSLSSSAAFFAERVYVHVVSRKFMKSTRIENTFNAIMSLVAVLNMRSGGGERVVRPVESSRPVKLDPKPITSPAPYHHAPPTRRRGAERADTQLRPRLPPVHVHQTNQTTSNRRNDLRGRPRCTAVQLAPNSTSQHHRHGSQDPARALRQAPSAHLQHCGRARAVRSSPAPFPQSQKVDLPRASRC